MQQSHDAKRSVSIVAQIKERLRKERVRCAGVAATISRYDFCIIPHILKIKQSSCFRFCAFISKQFTGLSYPLLSHPTKKTLTFGEGRLQNAPIHHNP